MQHDVCYFGIGYKPPGKAQSSEAASKCLMNIHFVFCGAEF